MKNNKPVALAIIALVVVVAVIAAITVGTHQNKNTDSNMNGMDMSGASQSQAASSNSTKAVATTQVAIESYAFSPQTITVKVGDTVTWTNHDSVHHTVTADDGSNSGLDSKLLGKGETYSFTFKKAGTYTYHCSPHPYMKGTVVVK